MLMILLPLMSMLLLHKTMKSWSCLIFNFMLISGLSFLYFSYSQGLMVSKWSALDKFSVPLITLTLWITSMMILASFKLNYFNQKKSFFILTVMLLNLILIMCFSSSNILLFYIWFEASLIPTAVLIIKWGYQPERMQASIYLLLYTVLASLPMLVCLLIIAYFSCNMNLFFTGSFIFPFNKNIMWVLCTMGFLVKLPMYLIHLWLPKAHVEAPVAGSMILAAILLKLGGYGLLRLTCMFPWLNKLISSMIMSISLVGAVITSMICLRQSDLKSLIAYSSVGHMGLLIAGTMSSTKWGMSGALAMMVAHGFSSSALFILANINYDMMNSRSIYLSKGAIMFTPVLSLWWFLFTIINMASPPSINLLSEIMLLTSITSTSNYCMIMLSLVSFLTAGYSLYMYTAINHANSNNYVSIYPCITLKDMTLLSLHLIPILLIILKPELII
uniref:NADH-ubiquinone oxidoreductase chain 4 n=1 Tax=Placobdella lamothei TaxID=1514856 RepID=A0A175D0E1_9ANNE|nr:NADH dehydrogenase subunit 4 [Placobdella lamothei]CVK87335.1 NADH dehydrogenase subunit 4 [Placobdella lamothei]